MIFSRPISLGSVIQNKESLSLITRTNTAGLDTCPALGLFKAALHHGSVKGPREEGYKHTAILRSLHVWHPFDLPGTPTIFFSYSTYDITEEERFVLQPTCSLAQGGEDSRCATDMRYLSHHPDDKVYCSTPDIYIGSTFKHGILYIRLQG